MDTLNSLSRLTATPVPSEVREALAGAPALESAGAEIAVVRISWMDATESPVHSQGAYSAAPAARQVEEQASRA